MYDNALRNYLLEDLKINIVIKECLEFGGNFSLRRTFKVQGMFLTLFKVSVSKHALTGHSLVTEKSGEFKSNFK